MKKTVLLFIAVATCFGAFAQRKATHSGKNVVFGPAAAAKSTAADDTVTMTNINLTTDTLTWYYADASPFDSGIVSGTDAYGDKGYAERYDWNAADSSLEVLGVVALFGGTYNAASTKTVDFKAWNQGAKTSVSTHTFYDGFPGTEIAAKNGVSIKTLGMGSTPTASDTPKLWMFTSPTSFLTDTFYVGYQINYNFAQLNGDTIGVYMNKDGERTAPIYTMQGSDTVVNVKNATMYSDGTWHDNAVDNFGIQSDFFLFAYVVSHHTLSVQGITKNDLTFFGSYPNPATSSTNVKFALKKDAKVVIDIMDASGRMITSLDKGAITAGEHIVNIETSSFAAGNYIYVLRTNKGDGIASQFTVAR
ncbi:MAG: T9SS type A sorting domain-containing protein [Bacteroidetes bacterium]|nr:T9SS type A sorting domain-containing protein [Bacteroidota bacterium]